ncbi:hypothetical protein EYF80_027030 [Liparis tanakae]|uniref:Uncharacterized protein n=1 Tax=Liparis tanakae TaxID=230148 RepID=A0A4Z2HD39_9TELE|nr:hypothetical protein EYF80_027030 [Liparis tanakae]
MCEALLDVEAGPLALARCSCPPAAPAGGWCRQSWCSMVIISCLMSSSASCRSNSCSMEDGRRTDSFTWRRRGQRTPFQQQQQREVGVALPRWFHEERVVTMCLVYAGSASCSSLLMFSLSLSGVRSGVNPGVTGPRGVSAPPGCGVMLPSGP